MYLDWRGLAGTTAVHIGMFLSPLNPLWGEAICLCRLPQPEPMMFDVSHVGRFVAFASLPKSQDLGGSPLSSNERCEGSPGQVSSPRLLSQTGLPPRLSEVGSVTLCVLVRPDGTVERVRVIETNGQKHDTLDQLKQIAASLSYAPARGDSNPITAEVELRTP